MRTELLEGNLPLPGSRNVWEKRLNTTSFSLLQALWQALWYVYLESEGSINTAYWHDKFEEEGVKEQFNLVIVSLAKAGWIESHAIPARNWAEAQLCKDKLLEFVTEEELTTIRANHKFAKYHLTFKESRIANKTRLNGKTKDTGLIREGFKAAGNTQFGYDTYYLAKYEKAIGLNLTKSMDKIRKFYPNMKSDKATYDEVSIAVMDSLLSQPNELYTTGDNYNDSRGRAISSCLGKVANPIASKDFRALLIVTYE